MFDSFSSIRSGAKATMPKFTGKQEDFVSWRSSFKIFAEQLGFLTILDQTDNQANDFTTHNFSDMRRLLRAGYSQREIQRARSAWSHLLEAQTSEALKRQVYRAGSPASAWKMLRERFLPSDAIHRELWEKKFRNVKMKKGSNPIDFFSELEGIVEILGEIGITKDESSIALRMLEGLSDDYSQTRSLVRVLGAEVSPNTIREVADRRYAELTALLSNDDKKHGHALITKVKGRGKRADIMKKQKEEDGDKRQPFLGKCYRCQQAGHKWTQCHARVIPAPTQTQPDGNGEDSAAGDKTNKNSSGKVLSVSHNTVVGAVAAWTFSTTALPAWLEKGSRNLEYWVGDTGASMHMTHSLLHMRNVRDCDITVRGINETEKKGERIGDLSVSFVSDNGDFQTELEDVLYVPDLGFNLFSPTAVFDGKTWERIGGPDSVMTAYNGKVNFCYRDKLLVASASRLPFELFALPALAPANSQQLLKVPMNDFHVLYGHANEQLLRDTAKRLCVELLGKLEPCAGCSMAKGYRKGIPNSTMKRATTKLGRVFVDLSGRKRTASLTGARYAMICKDDYTRYSWLYFLKHKSDAASALKRFLTDVRAVGLPSELEIVRSDNGGEFLGGRFKQLCKDMMIKQEFTSAHSPEFNGVAERGLGIITAAALAARIQATQLFHHIRLPPTEPLWAEAMHWACDALNHTATTANRDNVSPFEMWHGKAEPVAPYPFLKPGYCRWKRPNKSLPKAEACFYLGPADKPSERLCTSPDARQHGN